MSEENTTTTPEPRLNLPWNDPIEGAEECATSDVVKDLVKKNPELKQKYIQQELGVVSRLKAQKENKWPGIADHLPINPNPTIHLYFHILSPDPTAVSDDDIQAAVAVLSDSFSLGSYSGRWSHKAADTGIRFDWDTDDRIGVVTNERWSKGEDMRVGALGGSDPHQPTLYANIWICQVQGGYLGWGSPPGLSELEGITLSFNSLSGLGGGWENSIHADYVGTKSYGKTLVHEFGHFLNLRHIWGDGGCSADDSDGWGGWGGGPSPVDDTPTQDGPSWKCGCYKDYDSQGAYTGLICAGETGSKGSGGILKNTCNEANDEPDMWENFMDYSNDECRLLFSHGQANVMVDCLENLRSSLIWTTTTTSTTSSTTTSTTAAAGGTTTSSTTTSATPAVLQVGQNPETCPDLDLYVRVDDDPTVYYDNLTEGAMSLNHDAHPGCANAPSAPETAQGGYTGDKTFSVWFNQQVTDDGCAPEMPKGFITRTAEFENKGDECITVAQVMGPDGGEEGHQVQPGETYTATFDSYAGYGSGDQSDFQMGDTWDVACGCAGGGKRCVCLWTAMWTCGGSSAGSYGDGSVNPHYNDPATQAWPGEPSYGGCTCADVDANGDFIGPIEFSVAGISEVPYDVTNGVYDRWVLVENNCAIMPPTAATSNCANAGDDTCPSNLCVGHDESQITVAWVGCPGVPGGETNGRVGGIRGIANGWIECDPLPWWTDGIHTVEAHTTDGTGTGATFTLTVESGGILSNLAGVSILHGGANYAIGDTITISGDDLGDAGCDFNFEVDDVDPDGCGTYCIPEAQEQNCWPQGIAPECCPNCDPITEYDDWVCCNWPDGPDGACIAGGEIPTPPRPWEDDSTKPWFNIWPDWTWITPDLRGMHLCGCLHAGYHAPAAGAETPLGTWHDSQSHGSGGGGQEIHITYLDPCGHEEGGDHGPSEAGDEVCVRWGWDPMIGEWDHSETTTILQVEPAGTSGYPGQSITLSELPGVDRPGENDSISVCYHKCCEVAGGP